MIELWNYISIACVIITTLGGAGAIIVSVIKWFRSPDMKRDEELEKHNKLLDNDNKRIKDLEARQAEVEEAQKVLMRSMLAVMSHAIDGNHTDDLKEARDNLQEYLIRR